MERRELSKEELENELSGLNGWSVAGGKLARTFEFGDFSEAFAFMTRVAIEAERMEHHPEWSNVYNRVSISLVTHDVGNKISTYDAALAKKISEIYGTQTCMREILRLLQEGHEPTNLVAMKEAHQKHESQMIKCFALPRADMS